MARLCNTLAAALMLLSLPAAAETRPGKETIEADVSSRSVSITSSFTGTEILIFGTVENSRQPSAEAGTYDVVVVVEGTPAPLTVRKKSRIGGVWINAKDVRFSSMPSYYAIASTRPIEEIADAKILNQYEIGFHHVRMTPSGRHIVSEADHDVSEFREAVIRLKQRERLFITTEYGVTFIGRSLFRSTIALPPNVPVGPLVARVFLFQDGKMLSQYKSRVGLERAGIERFLHDTAFNAPLVYGLATVLMAAAAGMTAAFVFRKPGK